jgi:hypothetical protein
VFDKQAVFDAQDVHRDPRRRPAGTGETAMNHDVVIVGQN